MDVIEYVIGRDVAVRPALVGKWRGNEPCLRAGGYAFNVTECGPKDRLDHAGILLDPLEAPDGGDDQPILVFVPSYHDFQPDGVILRIVVTVRGDIEWPMISSMSAFAEVRREEAEGEIFGVTPLDNARSMLLVKIGGDTSFKVKLGERTIKFSFIENSVSYDDHYDDSMD